MIKQLNKCSTCSYLSKTGRNSMYSKKATLRIDRLQFSKCKDREVFVHPEYQACEKYTEDPLRYEYDIMR